ncbi:uncharacterized protein LOC132607997 [Lycium barbarum]|uniref:uncharacterized protein LOC132607997 n=1 Tax=Lycium barbarum TaxID=112863 RepID=UPI00293EA3B0|nr:uncharacterized protein LOC132607997 [Lycium barbarum]
MAIETETPSATGTPSVNIAPAVTPTTRAAVPPAEKPAKFTGANFKGWQQRMFFWLTTLGMQKFTSEDPPVPAADMPDNQKFMVTEAWKQADFLCKGYILSALEDDLYNVYSAIEEDNKTADKRYRKSSPIEGASVVEDAAPKKNNKRKRRSGKEKYPNKKKLKGNCYNCGKAGHKAPDCRAPKKDKEKNKGQANMVEDVDDLCAMLSECNLVGYPKEWWLDSGATRHVCAVKEAFTTYTPAGPDEELYMGNTEEPSSSRTTREKWV